MLPRPFLHHMVKQTPRVALAGARHHPPELPRGSYSPNPALTLPLLQPGALSISCIQPMLYTQPTSPVLLQGECMGTPRPLSTSQPSLDEAGHSHSGCHEPPRAMGSPLLWEKYLSSPKRPFPPPAPVAPPPSPEWDQSITSTAKDTFFLVCRESCGSPAISSTLGAILPTRSPARPACNYGQWRGLAWPAPGGGWVGGVLCHHVSHSSTPPRWHSSIMLPSVYLGCNIDSSSTELITPCKEMLPEKQAKRDTPKQQKAWQAQTVKGHFATAERQMDAAITNQNPIKSLCPQTEDVA